MNLPNLSCEIEAYCSINPSEDPIKIEKAVSNILSNCEIKKTKFSISAYSKDLQSLEKIFETIKSNQSQKIYNRNLQKNFETNSTWIYLNKQAALVDTVVICEYAEESPLGPIKLILSSKRIEEIIEWLTSKN